MSFSNFPPMPYRVSLRFIAYFVILGVSLEGASFIKCRASDVTSAESQMIDGQTLDHWLSDLSGKEYVQRKRAFQALWKVPKEELKKLFDSREASGPAEVSTRNWLVLLQRIDASPASASQMLDNLARIRSGDFLTVLRLAAAHRWSDLLSLLAMLSPEERLRLQSEPEELSTMKARLIELAWEDSRSDLIPALVDQLWEPSAAIAARLQWHVHGLDVLAEAPFYSSDPLVNSIPRQQLLRLEIAGRDQEAIQLAIENQDLAAAEEIALRCGRWSVASSIAIRKTDSGLTPGSIVDGLKAIEIAKDALLENWSGNELHSQQLLDLIGKPGLESNDVEGVLLALAVGDRIDQAMSILEVRTPDEAFSTLCVQEQTERALKVIGFKELNAVRAKEWVESQMTTKAETSEEDIQRLQRMAQVGSLLARLGKSDMAKIVDDATIQWATEGKNNSFVPKKSAVVKRNDPDDDEQLSRWKNLFRIWLSNHRRPKALQQSARLNREHASEQLRQAVLQELYPASSFPNISPIAWPLLLGLADDRKGDWQQASKDLERFAWGLAPENWPGNSHAGKGDAESGRSGAGRWEQHGFEKIAQRILPVSKNDLSESELPCQLARLAIEHSRYDLALKWSATILPVQLVEKITQALATSPSIYQPAIIFTRDERTTDRLDDYLNLLYEVYLAKQDYPRCQAVLSMLYQVDPQLGHLIERASCLEKLGAIDASDDLRRLAMTIPLSPETMHGIQQGLDHSKLYFDMARFAKATALSMPLTHPNYWFLTSQWFMAEQRIMDQDRDDSTLSDSLKNHAAHDGLRAGRLHLWSRLDAFPQRAPDFHYCLFLIERLHRSEARLAIENSDWEAADKAIRKCWKTNPAQIETPLELVPLARMKFDMERADSWIELYTQPLEEHLRSFPDDTLIGNNLAWLYANLDCQLTRSQTLAQHVVDLLEDDHMYLDTLGEVEFRLGNTQRAIEIAKQCRRLAPKETHYQKQLSRYLHLPQ